MKKKKGKIMDLPSVSVPNISGLLDRRYIILAVIVIVSAVLVRVLIAQSGTKDMALKLWA